MAESEEIGKIDLVAQKKAFRRQMIAKRDSLDVTRRAEKSSAISSAIAAALDEAQLETGSLVGIYSALGSEVRLEEFEKSAWERGWKLAYPCMVKNEQDTAEHMEFYLVPEEAAREKTAGFLAHPARAFAEDDEGLAGCVHVLPQELDVLLVPMVAFNGELLRMGYGGGNYDRYLPQLRDDAVVIGIAFDEQQAEELPSEPHDLSLPRIIHA